MILNLSSIRLYVPSDNKISVSAVKHPPPPPESPESLSGSYPSPSRLLFEPCDQEPLLALDNKALQEMIKTSKEKNISVKEAVKEKKKRKDNAKNLWYSFRHRPQR